MAIFQRKLKVGKTDTFTLDIAAWIESESISTSAVSTEDTDIVGINLKTVDGSKITVSLTGLQVGYAELLFEYTTSSRSDCYKARVAVVASC
jgi:hypothetical protein